MMEYKFSAPVNAGQKRTVLLSFGRKGRTLCLDTGIEFPVGAKMTNNMVIGKDSWSEQMNRTLDYVLAVVKGFAESPDLEPVGNADIKTRIERRLQFISSTAAADMTLQQAKENVQPQMAESGSTLTMVSLTDRMIEHCRAVGRVNAANRLKNDRKYILEYFGNMPVRQIKKKHIIGFKKMLEGQGRVDYFSEQVIVRLKSTWKEGLSNKWFSVPSTPFEGFKAVYKGEPKQCDLSETEFYLLAKYHTRDRKEMFARDMFLLSFCLGGVTMNEIMEFDFSKRKLEYLRMTNKNPDVAVPTVFCIQKEARGLIRRWFGKGGFVNPFPLDVYQCQMATFVNGQLRLIGQKLGIENELTMYSARRTFCHFAFKLGVNQNIIKYCIGQCSFTRNVIYNYVQVAEEQANLAFRSVIDYSFKKGTALPEPVGNDKMDRYRLPSFKNTASW